MPTKNTRETVKEVAVSFTRRLRLEEKTCPQCGASFQGVKIKKFCSRECQRKADYERNAATYRAARVEKYRQQKQQASKS